MNHVQYHVSWFVVRTESGKAPDADGKFSNAPYFNFNDDKVKFDTNDVSNANDDYGTASGFSPKYLDVSSKGILYWMPFVLLNCGSYPTAEHSTDLVNNCLKYRVLLHI